MSFEGGRHGGPLTLLTYGRASRPGRSAGPHLGESPRSAAARRAGAGMATQWVAAPPRSAPEGATERMPGLLRSLSWPVPVQRLRPLLARVLSPAPAALGLSIDSQGALHLSGGWGADSSGWWWRQLLVVSRVSSIAPISASHRHHLTCDWQSSSLHRLQRRGCSPRANSAAQAASWLGRPVQGLAPDCPFCSAATPVPVHLTASHCCLMYQLGTEGLADQ